MFDNEVARHAESLGYKRIWLAEHQNMEHIASSATAVLIGHIAGIDELMVTSHIYDMEAKLKSFLIVREVMNK